MGGGKQVTTNLRLYAFLELFNRSVLCDCFMLNFLKELFPLLPSWDMKSPTWFVGQAELNNTSK